MAKYYVRVKPQLTGENAVHKENGVKRGVG